MVKIELELTDDVYANLVIVADACTMVDAHRDGGTTHGALDVPKLLAMLAEDAAMTHSRPGSSEGANMQKVLNSHGYEY